MRDEKQNAQEQTRPDLKLEDLPVEASEQERVKAGSGWTDVGKSGL